jgi:hypothetical protein
VARVYPFIPVGGDEQDGSVAYAPAEETQEVGGGLIGPVDVFHYHDVQLTRLADLAQQSTEQMLAGSVRAAQFQQLATALAGDIEKRPERPGSGQPVAGPQYQLSPGRSCCNCSTSADFPAPASPATNTSRHWAFRASSA